MEHLIRFLQKEKRAIMARIAVDQGYRSESKKDLSRVKSEIEINQRLLKDIDKGLVILKKGK